MNKAKWNQTIKTARLRGMAVTDDGTEIHCFREGSREEWVVRTQDGNTIETSYNPERLKYLFED